MGASERKPWWRTEPLSIIEIGDEFDVIERGEAGFDPAPIVARMKALHATAAHVFPLGMFLDGETLFFRHQSPGDPPPAFDYLDGWLAHARPAGLRTIVYVNVHCAELAFARRHPDWQQRRFDGSPKEDLYSTDSTFCVNSPWRDWVFDRLRELCAYPIDGVFFDGPAFYETCYCNACRAKYERRFGGPMPQKDPAHPDFEQLVAFQSDSLAEFLRDSRGVIKAVSPDLLFYMNSNPVTDTWRTGRDNRKLASHQDLLAAEGGFLYGDLHDTPLWKVGLNAKVLEAEAAAAGVPTLVFNCIAHNPWTFQMLPPAEVALLWASSVAHGAGTWMATFRASIDDPALDAVAPLYEFARRHRAELWGTESLADIAVVVSKPTLNSYGGAPVAGSESRAGSFAAELDGWYRALWSSQVPFDVIDEVGAEADLSRYRLVVLPNVACLSDAGCAALDRFVREGGTLAGTFDTAGCDGRGRRRTRPGLNDTFGVTLRSAESPPSREWDYAFCHGASPWTRGIRAPFVPSPAYVRDVDAAGAEVVMTFAKPLPGRYGHTPEDAGRPAMTIHRLGRGTAVYFAGALGEALGRYGFDDHLRLVGNLVEHSASPRVHFPDAPPCLEVSLRTSADRRAVLLHLVNYNGGMLRPIRRVVPLRDLHVRLLLDRPAAKVEALFSGRPPEWARTAEGVHVVIPELREYELIRIEQGG